MKLRNVVAVMVALAIGTTIVVAQNGGIGRTLAAVEAFLNRFGPEAALAVGAADQTSVAQSATDFRWSGRVAEGEALEIKGVNGPIEVARAQGVEALVTAEVRARRSDPGTVTIERVEHAGGITFCAVYPTPEGNSPNRCEPGSEGRMSTRDNDVSVRFRVELPAGVDFVGRTVNGGIEARGLASDVRAVTVNGDVVVTTTGFAEAQTVNGSIEASMGRAEVQGGASFQTVNGSIELDLPDDVDAEIDASWLNGSFESDLPFLLQGRVSRRSAQGTLGAGGPRLELETVNGSIRIR